MGRKSTKENKNIYVIVPEQETVKMEAELIENCGNRINKSVEVINFSRLANRVFREAGGMTYTYIDSAGKDLVAAVILEKMKKDEDGNYPVLFSVGGVELNFDNNNTNLIGVSTVMLMCETVSQYITVRYTKTTDSAGS